MNTAPVSPSWSLTSWPYDVTTAALTLQSGHQPDTRIDDELVREWAHAVATTTYQRIRTNAIGPSVADDLARVGFGVRQELVLLQRDLAELPSMPRRTSNGIGRIRMASAVSIDLAAFGDEWALDTAALNYAINATQEAHLRGGGVRRGPFSRATGYCLTGFTDDTGYVQRLAVHPSAQRHGLARTLVEDALTWLSERGATSVYVNTDVDNVAALHLYDSFDFRPLEHRLHVMEISRSGLVSQLDTVTSDRDGCQ